MSLPPKKMLKFLSKAICFLPSQPRTKELSREAHPAGGLRKRTVWRLQLPRTTGKLTLLPRNLTAGTWKWWFPKGISFSRDLFSGSMLNFRGVIVFVVDGQYSLLLSKFTRQVCLMIYRVSTFVKNWCRISSVNRFFLKENWVSQTTGAGYI